MSELGRNFRLPREGTAAIILVRTENAQELDEPPTLRDQRLVRGLPGVLNSFPVAAQLKAHGLPSHFWKMVLPTVQNSFSESRAAIRRRFCQT